MKIHFVYPNVNTFMYPDVHHGLASIFATLKSNGHQVSLQYLKNTPKKNDFLETVHREKPDLIGFSSVTNQIRFVDLCSSWIKEEFDTPTICGGVHATIFPNEIAAFNGIDMICQGEGEYPLLELAADPKRYDIKNIRFKKQGKMFINAVRAPVHDLDELPFPDYQPFNPEKILKDRNGDFSVMASRGCPFSCTYCCNHAIRNVQAENRCYFRVRGVDSFLNQLGQLVQNYPIKHFTFSDDVFGVSKKWSQEFCEKYPKHFDIEFECNARPETANEEFLKNLVSANCNQVDMGIEVGNEWLRKEILNRKMTNSQIINAFETAHRVGLKTFSYNMVGLPYETSEMVKETIELNKRVKPDQIAITVFYPYPGTQLFDLCLREGYISQRNSASYMSESILDLPTMSLAQLNRLYTEFYCYLINRRLEWYPVVVRIPLSAIIFTSTTLFGKRAIDLFLKIYSPFLRIISLLETKRHRIFIRPKIHTKE